MREAMPAEVVQGVLGRLTAAMNGRNPDSHHGNEQLEPMAYCEPFVRALLGYSHGGAGEADTLSAMQVEDPSVLPGFARRLSASALRVGMDDAALAELADALGRGA